jgi:hypothetical protein
MKYAKHDYHPEYEERKVTTTQGFLSPLISRNRSCMSVHMFINVVSAAVPSLFFLCFEKFYISHYNKAYDSLDAEQMI